MRPEVQGFGVAVRRLREERRIGLRQFARMIEVSATYLSKIERDELPPPAEDRVKAIARQFEQDPDEMLALAGKVASDLNMIIRSHPREMADFLRTASGLSRQELKRLTKQAERSKEAGSVLDADP